MDIRPDKPGWQGWVWGIVATVLGGLIVFFLTEGFGPPDREPTAPAANFAQGAAIKTEQLYDVNERVSFRVYWDDSIWKTTRNDAIVDVPERVLKLDAYVAGEGPSIGTLYLERAQKRSRILRDGATQYNFILTRDPDVNAPEIFLKVAVSQEP